MASREAPVLKAVCAYLGFLESQGKLVMWRQNNIGVWDAQKGIYRKPRGVGSKEGVPDICAVILPTGRFVGVECKSASGRQSDAQKAMQNAIEAVGGLYILARSVDDVAALIR